MFSLVFGDPVDNGASSVEPRDILSMNQHTADNLEEMHMEDADVNTSCRLRLYASALLLSLSADK